MHEFDIAPVSPVPVARAYPLWAPTYERDNPVSVLDENTVSTLTPKLAGRTLLDVGCGAGRRLRAVLACQPRAAIGIDLALSMLKQNPDPSSRCRTAAGDLRHLPIRDGAIDVVWCRLAIGHVPDLTSAYAELARVTRPGGAVIVTDFHPDAAAAGHRRTFRDANGAAHAVEHFVHPVSRHEAVADRLGLTLAQRIDARVGPVVESLYQAAGRPERYAEQRGLPLVLALRFDL